MLIWSTKSQHTHNTSKCTEFDGGFEFSQQIMNWSTKSQKVDFGNKNFKKGPVTLKKGLFIKTTGGRVGFFT